MFQGFELAHPNIYPIWFWGTMVAGSPWFQATADCLRGVSGSIDGVPEGRGLEPNLQPITQWAFAVWTKGATVWHTAVPNDTKTDEEVMERQERRGAKWVLFSWLCFAFFVVLWGVFLLVFIFILFYFFLNFLLWGTLQGWRADTERLRNKWDWGTRG